MISIQLAIADDIPALRDLAHRIWHEYYPGIITREQIDYMLARMYDAGVISREMAEGVRWYLVECEAGPVGFFSFELEAAARLGSRRVKLHKLYLLPSVHGQGIGRQMIEFVKAQAVRWRADEIRLQVNKQNARAIRAYERAGFKVREAVVADIGGGFVMDDFILVLSVE